jgi:AraC-like DNA-binding protein
MNSEEISNQVVRAAVLLKGTVDMKMTDLPAHLGLCSAEYFREVFKGYVGVAPSVYRGYKNHW